MRRSIFHIVFVVFTLGCNPAYTQQIFHDCPMEGSATTDALKALNRQKNIYDFATHIDSSITIQTLIAVKDNHLVGKQAEIEGYVVGVKPGGVEGCNCKTKDITRRDTHIEIVTDPKHAKPNQKFIVEVTPRFRENLKYKFDWSTATLKKTLLHHWVKFKGWIFWDAEHTNASESTHPKGKHNWRISPSEIHPITQITIIK